MTTTSTTWQNTPDARDLVRLRETLEGLRAIAQTCLEDLDAGHPVDLTEGLVMLEGYVLPTALQRVVDLRRADGSTWTDIASDLRVTRQAATKRFTA